MAPCRELSPPVHGGTEGRRTAVWALRALVAAVLLSLPGCPRPTSPQSALGFSSVERGAKQGVAAREAAEQPQHRGWKVPPELATDGPVDRLGLVVHGSPSVLTEPRGGAKPISRCEPGDYVPIIEARNGHAGVRMSDGATGWLPGWCLEVLSEPATPELRPEDPDGMRYVVRAMTYLGVPYVWGGTSVTGMDCSGFVQRVFKEEGVALPRIACDQANVGMPVVMGALEPGDRVYFQAGKEIDHTGMYIGGGRFIHASGSGDAVRIDELFTNRWQRIYAGARR